MNLLVIESFYDLRTCFKMCYVLDLRIYDLLWFSFL